ncbi:TIGR00297 family protein [Methanobacterium sp.]|uniref:TIGR00297 family protein n=1 Tax=Methanobacterium sp. TaxID=2164 RepID=UPI0025F5DCF0|nr:TIGR00297 family protein [Methanobacterium sp.]MBI5458510.1 TIGR00297 family protein [Methanobacterium sp.]MDY9923460.1 TIGR00297 family protein [Methanobacterium sp.]
MIIWEYVILLVIIGLITYKRKALDLLGSIFMIIMGVIIIFAAGVNWLLLIFLFLILGVAFTRYKHDYKKEIGVYEGTRTIKNVVSNGIVAFVMAAFGNYAGFIGSIATATADTMASEVGVATTPRLITNLKKVPPGTDGGISVLGTFAGIIGAGLIGLAAYILGVYPDLVKTMEIAIIAGTFGCFVDSILGAVLEIKGYLSNEHVNLLATLAGALLGNIMVWVIW